MGNDIAEVVETLPSPSAIKVHKHMCMELMNLLDGVSKIFPEIDAARPGCSSGIQALCLLNNAIEKAKLLLQHCSESSKLYLSLTGNVILSRCKKSRNLLEQSLGQLQTMVPVMLAVKMSRVIDDIKAATFNMDPSEEEVGKILKSLLHQYASTTNFTEPSVPNSLQFAASRLHITSQKALLIEKRSIKNLLNKIDENNQQKKQILKFLLHLLNKYGSSIMRDQQTDDGPCIRQERVRVPSPTTSSCDQYGIGEVRSDVLVGPTPPEEFKCPMSSRLMYDPVVIASGETFERMWIEKWFSEGHDTCPKTKQKLPHLSIMPNSSMKELIRKWCLPYNFTIPDPFSAQIATRSLETSLTSIASLTSSINDLCVPADFSSVSIGSLNDSRDFQFQSGAECKPEIDLEIVLVKLDELAWETRCEVVEDFAVRLEHNGEACHGFMYENFVEPIVGFLKEAYDLGDVKAQRDGCLLFLQILRKCRSNFPYLQETVYHLLALLLDSEVTKKEALAITELLSWHHFCRSEIAKSGAISPLVKILDTKIKELQELAIKTIHNLSFDENFCSRFASLECISKLIPLFEEKQEDDTALSTMCLSIFHNLCENRDSRVSVAETKGCIASISRLLEVERQDDQEMTVAILLSLCSQRAEYCFLVMEEGVVPALVSISVNGTHKGKASAMELLRLLRDVEYDSDPDGKDSANNGSVIVYLKEKKPPSKNRGFFGKISRFSKKISLA